MDVPLIHAPEFPDGLTWLNVDRPLRLREELRGQVVLLDFWTYCCINCLHVIPDLAYLEEKYAHDPVTIIGVHSHKYDNEAAPEHIRLDTGAWIELIPKLNGMRLPEAA